MNARYEIKMELQNDGNWDGTVIYWDGKGVLGQFPWCLYASTPSQLLTDIQLRLKSVGGLSAGKIGEHPPGLQTGPRELRELPGARCSGLDPYNPIGRSEPYPPQVAGIDEESVPGDDQSSDGGGEEPV